MSAEGMPAIFAKRPRDWFQRMERWRHNSFLGHARMMYVQACAISDARTTTPETKRLATEIAALALQLSQSLKVRNDAQTR